MPDSKSSILHGLEFDDLTSALQQSMVVQAECAQVGFDWPSVDPVFEKVEEEIAEIKEALANTQKSHADVVEEVGDLLFASVNLCRHLDVDPDTALIEAKNKFTKRFQTLEIMLKNADKEISKTSLLELEEYWLLAKEELKKT